MNKNSQNITPGQRLKLARESLKDANGKKLTQAEFSKRINYSRNTLGKFEKGLEDIPDPVYLLLRDIFNINPHWLRTGEGDMFLKVVHKSFEDKEEGGSESFTKRTISKLRSEVERVSNKFFEHPGIRVWALAGGGDPWEPAEDAEPMETIELANFLNPKYRDSFRVWGESMEPVVRHNALVFCDFNDKQIRSGEIFALNIRGEGLVVKELRSVKLEIGEPLKLMIYSYNELRYPASYYSHEELIDGNIIVGRIVLIHQETNK